MKIERITADEKDAAVGALCQAFRDYPVMRYTLKDADSADYDDQLASLIGFFADARFMRGNPVLGIRDEGRLAAVLLGNRPEAIPWPPELVTVYSELKELLGEAAWSRLEAFEEATSSFEPEAVHHYIGMIGVLPEYQGKGYGTVLMREMESVARAHQESIGICLTTEDPDNVPYYQHLGYEVIGEADVDEMHTWYMLLRTR